MMIFTNFKTSVVITYYHFIKVVDFEKCSSIYLSSLSPSMRPPYEIFR